MFLLGLLGAVFRLVMERSDRFRDAVIDWAHGKEIYGFALLIGFSAIATGFAYWLVRKFAPGGKGRGIPDVEAGPGRAGERRVGEEGRASGAPDHLKKKKKNTEIAAVLIER